MKLVRSALDNPHAVVVMVLAIIILGITAATRIPTDLLPIFKTPAVQILTLYPGMPADVMERDITTRLERWTGQSNGIARQESKSMIGVSIVKDYFRPDIDPNTAMSQVTSLAMSDLYYQGSAKSQEALLRSSLELRPQQPTNPYKSSGDDFSS